ncbi:MAG: ABC transporter ATP-binding protein/permease [Defluviitaleaceae bacterium]|nr:ABC transporter ATP-binding protein/permease [Defluviitaleaceae bacterium]
MIKNKTAKKLFQYAWGEKKLMSVALIMLFVSIITELLAPLLMMNIIDHHIVTQTLTSDTMPAIVRLAILYFGLIATSAIFAYGQRYFLGLSAEKIIKKMRQDVFSHIQTMPIKYFDNLPAGKIVSRITNDTSSARNLYLNILTNFVAGGLQMLGVLIALYVLDVRFALICTLIIPILFIWIKFYRKLATVYNQKIRSRLSDINGMLNESISGMPIIQAFRGEKRTSDEFQEMNEDYYENQRKMLNLDAATGWNMLSVLQNLALLAIVWFFGGQFLQTHTAVSVGLLYTFIDYLNRLFRPIMGIVGQLSTLEASIVSSSRVFELMAEENEILSEQIVPRYAGNVLFEHVDFAYDENNPVLKDITLSAKCGETVALVGHTGSGKSSIMSALFGFYPYQKGRISIDGKDINDIPKQEYRQHMGIVLQDAYLFAGTIASNIGLDNPNISRAKIEAALEAVGAMDFINQLPGGLDAPVLERGSTFSTGQRQLLSFARALAFDPAILILDEATANIDTETEGLIQKALSVLKKGRTTFVIAHRLSTIRDADQILVLDRGEIVERGNHQTLMALKGKYNHMYQLQLRGSGLSLNGIHLDSGK